MKAIILLLVFSSGLFADTIRYTVNGEEKVKDNVTFKRTDGEYIYYITPTKSFSKIECHKVVEIISKTGENIDYSCLELSKMVKEEPNKKISKTNLQKELQLNSTDYIFFPIFGYSKTGKLKKYFKIILGGSALSFLSMSAYFASSYSIGFEEIGTGIGIAWVGVIATQIYLRIELKKEIIKYNKNLYKNINDVKPQN